MTPFPAVKMITAAVAAALLLAACAAEPGGRDGSTGGPMPQAGTALPPPTAGESAAAASLPVVPSEPLPAPESTSEVPKGGEPVVVQGPDGTTWTVLSPKDEAAYQADVDDCFHYASAQTRNDAQIIDDRNAGIDTLTSQSRYSGLRQRVDEFDLRNRRASLMSSCMESKGYTRADTVLPRLEF
jgi:hypothetical protein